MSKPFAFHPLMFAIFPILALYAHNSDEVAPSDILMPLGVVLGVTILLTLVFALILKNIKKSSIIISVFLVLFFSYGYVAGMTGGWSISDTVFLPIWGILIICCAFFVIRTRRDLHGLTVILNMVAITLVLVPAISIAVHETRVAWQSDKTAEDLDTKTVDIEGTDVLPDIYYIIFDRYASESTLKEVYGFDNSEFLDFLSSRGFYVASESTSNYPETHHSLASSLSMEYINYLSEQLGDGCSDVRPIYSMLEDYKVWRFLKQKGYTFIHFGSWWEPTKQNKYADVNVNYWDVPEFSWLLLKTTMIYPIIRENDRLPDWLKSPFIKVYHKGQWQRVPFKFQELAKIPDMKEPTFVFAHMFVPHNPFVFDKHGNYVSEEEAEKRGYLANYVDQLIYANSQIRVLIDDLLSKSETPPIIILQSDEGPYSGGQDERSDWDEANDAELKEKMRILNAYYLPNVDNGILYPSITPVNSFRVIFDLYFGTDFELLPDRNYGFYKDHPYKFFDVTNRVQQ